MFDAVLVNLALDGTVFDAIAAFGKLREVERTYVVCSTRLYLRVNSFLN